MTQDNVVIIKAYSCTSRTNSSDIIEHLKNYAEKYKNRELSLLQILRTSTTRKN
jgi:hypothetical protein